MQILVKPEGALEHFVPGARAQKPQAPRAGKTVAQDTTSLWSSPLVSFFVSGSLSLRRVLPQCPVCPPAGPVSEGSSIALVLAPLPLPKSLGSWIPRGLAGAGWAPCSQAGLGLCQHVAPSGPDGEKLGVCFTN